MKRWFIARLGDYDADGSIGPKVSQYTNSYRIWSKTGFGWCFGQLAAKDLSAMQEDADIHILPDGVMDLSVGSIPVAVRNTLRTRLEAAGFAANAIKTSWTVRQLLHYIVGQIQPDTNVEAGDVQDVET